MNYYLKKYYMSKGSWLKSWPVVSEIRQWHVSGLLWPSVTGWVAYEQQKLMSLSSGGCKSEIRCQQGGVLVRLSLKVQRFDSSLCPPWTDREERALWGPFHKGTNPNHEGSPLWSNHLPKTPPPDTITWGLMISTLEFWGNTNIRSITWHKGRNVKYIK